MRAPVLPEADEAREVRGFPMPPRRHRNPELGVLVSADRRIPPQYRGCQRIMRDPSGPIAETSCYFSECWSLYRTSWESEVVAVSGLELPATEPNSPEYIRKVFETGAEGMSNAAPCPPSSGVRQAALR